MRLPQLLLGIIAASIAYFACLTASLNAQPPPTPRLEALARQYWEDDGGVAGWIKNDLSTKRPLSEYEVGVLNKSLSGHAADISEADRQAIDLIARTYTASDLSAFLDFRHSELGQSIFAKQRAAQLSAQHGKFEAPKFSEAEKRVMSEYRNTSDGKSFTSKGLSLIQPLNKIVRPIEKIVLADYCGLVSNCPIELSDFIP